MRRFPIPLGRRIDVVPFGVLVAIIAGIVTFLDRIVVVVVRRLPEQTPPPFERRQPNRAFVDR